MTFVFSGHRPNIATPMASGDKEIRDWLMRGAVFVKTSQAHWFAWRANDADRIMVLPLNHPKGEPGLWIDNLGSDFTLESAIEYFDSGEFDADPPGVLNLFIEDPVTGEWK